LENNLIF